MKYHSNHSVKQISTIFLQAVIVLVGIVTLAIMLLEPHLEGVNAHAKFFEVYLDPFVALVYIGSIPFFVALFQAFKLLGLIGKHRVFSQAAVNTLRAIKYCAFIVAGAIIAADVYVKIAAHSSNDDPAGAMMLGMIATFASIVIGTTAAVFERTLQSAVDLKSENDLTV